MRHGRHSAWYISSPNLWKFWKENIGEKKDLPHQDSLFQEHSARPEVAVRAPAPLCVGTSGVPRSAPNHDKVALGIRQLARMSSRHFLWRTKHLWGTIIIVDRARRGSMRIGVRRRQFSGTRSAITTYVDPSCVVRVTLHIPVINPHNSSISAGIEVCFSTSVKYLVPSVVNFTYLHDSLRVFESPYSDSSIRIRLASAIWQTGTLHATVLRH